MWRDVAEYTVPLGQELSVRWQVDADAPVTHAAQAISVERPQDVRSKSLSGPEWRWTPERAGHYRIRATAESPTGTGAADSLNPSTSFVQGAARAFLVHVYVPPLGAPIQF